MAGRNRKGGKRGRNPNGAGTVYRRSKDGKFVAQATLHSGKRKSWLAATQEEALRLMREGQARDAQGLPVTSSQRPLHDWLQDWLNDIKAPNIRPHSLDAYRVRLQHVADAIGPMPLANVKAADIRRIYSDMRDNNFSPATIASTHRALRTALNDAVKDGLLIANPCRDVVPPKPIPQHYTTLSVDQVSQLVAAEPSTMWRALWALLATTGIRIGEAAALSWPVVDLQAGEVHVEHTLARLPGGGWTLGEPKTKTSQRLVYIGQKTVSHLAAWKREQAEQPVASRQRFVFLGMSGQPIHADTAGRALHKTLWSAGLPKLRIHDLRHSAATNMLAMGIPVKVVSEMLGHSTTSITLDLYGHTVPAMHKEAQARIDALL